MDTEPAWVPSAEDIENANLTHFMRKFGINNLADLRHWSVNNFVDFWPTVIRTLGIVFISPSQKIYQFDPKDNSTRWLVGAKLNIADSCFTAPQTATAIIYEDDSHVQHRVTYRQLEQLSNQVANSLITRGFSIGDAIAIAMPMNIEAIATYLGIIKMGGVVVSIADSFSSNEIATRLSITQAKAVFTQDYIYWNRKRHALYEKLCAASAPRCIVVETNQAQDIALRKGDLTWNTFLVSNPSFTSNACDPMASCNILFSSGTTGNPKAIPWNHTTPIKAASDAYFHHNIKPGDVLAWPTNLGWMMGPWLVFSALINHATIAIYSGAPTDRLFGTFVKNAGVTMLGVVPTLVATWRQSKCMEGLDWSKIKLFSSTGECSNAEDMRYLMSLANNKPTIEYCGGTEIGGAYLSSTIIENNYPSQFTGPTIGINFSILNEEGDPASSGEVALIPPSIGLSTSLLNADHQKIYFSNMPIINGIQLRRHGDRIARLPNGNFVALGRVDDTMNLSGIKISAAEIERAIAGIPNIVESAAIANQPNNAGPNQLIIFTVTKSPLEKHLVLKEMQTHINQNLSPLFKIHDVIFIDALPKTASNKIIRRLLRS